MRDRQASKNACHAATFSITADREHNNKEHHISDKKVNISNNDYSTSTVHNLSLSLSLSLSLPKKSKTFFSFWSHIPGSVSPNLVGQFVYYLAKVAFTEILSVSTKESDMACPDVALRDTPFPSRQ